MPRFLADLPRDLNLSNIDGVEEVVSDAIRGNVRTDILKFKANEGEKK